MAIEIKEVVIRALIDPDYNRENKEAASATGGSQEKAGKKKDKCCDDKKTKEQQQQAINQLAEIMRNEKER